MKPNRNIVWGTGLSDPIRTILEYGESVEGDSHG